MAAGENVAATTSETSNIDNFKMTSFKITISDPQKQGDGLNAYISYKVSSQMSEKSMGLEAMTYTVVRRFNDFVWLRNQLREALPYLIIPSLPEKQQIGRFNTDFVDVRHRALQRWADRISTHAEITTTDSFRKFISFPAEAFAALRDGSRADMVKGVAEEGKKTVMKFVKTATNAVSSTIHNLRGTAVIPSSPSTAGASRSAEDMSFAELETYLLGQAPLLTALYNEAAAVAVRAREQAQLLLDYGASLRALGHSEGGPVGQALSVVGLASWAASTASYEQAVCETELFVEKLADYVRGTRAVKECIDSRGKASAELAEAVAEVERLRALIVALAASPTPQAAASKAQAEVDLQMAQKASSDARSFYDKCAAGVIGEVERMRSSMRSDFRSMLLEFIATQVRTDLKLASAWDRIAAEAANAVTAEGAQMPALGASVSGSSAPSNVDGGAAFGSVF